MKYLLPIVVLSLGIIGCNVGRENKEKEGNSDAGENADKDSGSRSSIDERVQKTVDESGDEPIGGGTPAEDASTGGAGSDESCGGIRLKPDPIVTEVVIDVPYEVKVPAPVTIYLMLDRSTSMEEISGSVSKWTIMADAINTFTNDSASNFLAVGLQYFSIDGAGCDGTGYDAPAVPVRVLPDNADTISDSLASTQLGDFTPMEPALRGLTAFCAQFQAEHPDEPCVGVLVSGSAPTQCSLETNALVGISEDAYDNLGVQTFTVGMDGADFDLLDQIAMWGGTDCTPADSSDGYTCNVDSNMTFIEALEAIRAAVTHLVNKTAIRTENAITIAKCEWGIPDPPAGEVFDPDEVNLFFSSTAEADIVIERIPRGRTCDDFSSIGWYYDDIASPTKIIACDQTCEFIDADVEGRAVEIEFGCATIER